MWSCSEAGLFKDSIASLQGWIKTGGSCGPNIQGSMKDVSQIPLRCSQRNVSRQSQGSVPHSQAMCMLNAAYRVQTLHAPYHGYKVDGEHGLGK